MTVHAKIGFLYLHKKRLLLPTCINNCLLNLCTSDFSTPIANCSMGELRLVGSEDGDEGRLEVCVNGAWGTVCSNGFDTHETSVACHTLGRFNGSSEFYM